MSSRLSDYLGRSSISRQQEQYEQLPIRKLSPSRSYINEYLPLKSYFEEGKRQGGGVQLDNARIINKKISQDTLLIPHRMPAYQKYEQEEEGNFKNLTI
jgi:hypothetical protein